MGPISQFQSEAGQIGHIQRERICALFLDKKRSRILKMSCLHVKMGNIFRTTNYKAMSSPKEVGAGMGKFDSPQELAFNTTPCGSQVLI